jgi:hypothetical protein
MRSRSFAAMLVALVVCGAFAASASAGTASTLTRPTPSWNTQDFAQRVHDAGAAGVQLSAERLNTDCPGFAQPGVSAAGCIVAPYGCTANFIFTDGSSYYIGTARHCVDKVGDELVMQVDPTTLAAVGSVVKHTSGDGEPGNDFSLTKLYPDVVAKWGVSSAVPLVGGPQGVYDGCDPQPVKYYGHGYGVAVAQGKPEGGLATNWNNNGYGWTGVGAPGDSGSPVLIGDGRAAGDFTHLIVDLQQYPGSDHAGMRMTAILQFVGPSIKLVNADGSTTTSGAANCGSQTATSGLFSAGKGGGGGGKSAGGKGGGGKKSPVV